MGNAAVCRWRALVSRPQVLILDEPTVGLDPVLRADLWRRFRRLADDGVTLLVSSHVMDEAEQCDNLILMREGALVAELAPPNYEPGQGRPISAGVPGFDRGE